MNRVLFVKTHVDGYVRRDTGQPVALDSSPVRSDEPTPAQAESGNYAKRVLPWKGLTIRIENEAGSVRRGTDPNGQAWESRMAHPYGYVVGSMGVDGDPVDVYVGPFAETAKQVFVVHQRRVGDWKKYDEDKVFIGMLNEEDVKAAFLQCYDDPRFLGPITAMPVDEFVAKVKATRTAPRMIKARVGPYIRLGKLVNIHGYDGRQARSGAAAGQASLFSEEDAPAPRPKKADLARHDHTNQADLFATEGEYHGIETRPGTEQAQIDAGEAALRDFSRHLFGVRADREQAPSILGARLYKGFTESGGAKLIGQRCATPADLAAIAQVYRDPRFETFRAVFVRDGEVVGESAYSSRMPGAVYLPDGVHNEIGRDGEAFGADGFYIVHNHPSGSAQPSQADIRVTVTAAELVAGFLGHVVIDHKEYASIEADGAYQVIQEPALTGTDFHSSPTLEHALLGSRVSSPKDVALVAKALQANGELENPVLVLTKGQNSEVELLTSFPKSLLPAPKSHKAAVKAKAWLRRVGRRTGAGALAFLVVSEKHMQDRFTLESLIRSGVVTDVVDSTGFSLRQSGIHPASGDGLWEASRRAQRVLFAKPAAPVRQTDTPQFREWFGSSKVRDENGEPMRMYHITPHDFDTFHPGGKEVLDGHPKGQSGRAIWFSPDKEEQPAAHNTRTRSGYQPGTNVMPVYLRIERPLLIDSETMMEWARNAFGEGSSMFPQIMLSKWVDAVKEGGYDGIIFKGKDLGWGQNGDEYIAFEPEQIKSAIGNNGDFSKESPVITKSTQAAADRRPILFLKAKLRTDDRTIDMFSTHLETKTRKDGVVQKYRVANAKPATVTEPRAEMVKEHERLVRVLESPSHEDDKAEAKRQKKELEEYKGEAKKPAKDWRDEENWHSRTMARMKTLSEDQLRFIVKDATEAAQNGEAMGSSKAGQYRDEAHYAAMELEARRKAAAPKVAKVEAAKPGAKVGPFEVKRDPQADYKAAVRSTKKGPTSEEAANPRLKFYVTIARKGKGVGRLAGPFDTHAEAEAMVDRARTMAQDVDPFSSFDYFGTAGVEADEHKPGVLNERLGIANQSIQPLPHSDDHPAPIPRPALNGLSDADRERWKGLHREQHELRYWHLPKLRKEMERHQGAINRALEEYNEQKAAAEDPLMKMDPARAAAHKDAADKAFKRYQTALAKKEAAVAKHQQMHARMQALGKEKDKIVPKSGDLDYVWSADRYRDTHERQQHEREMFRTYSDHHKAKAAPLIKAIVRIRT